MGQAKRRGTFEQRKAKAIEKDYLTKKEIENCKQVVSRFPTAILPFMILGGMGMGSGISDAKSIIFNYKRG
ncbi:hypothetical protein M0P65_05890 [Candidatus Gracilibacteria bacterium]|jgi:hypothetical protein|nr:hypothetical protein [Candidatus Gracilibacteria bacterium]